MIKGINPQGKYVQVQGGSTTNYINNYSGAQGVGNMRFNTTNQNIEIYDGNSWQQLQMSYATVGLNYDAESLLDWVRVHRDEEFARNQKIKENPALQKAYEAIKRAEANFDILYKFVENDTEYADAVMSPAMQAP